MRALILNSDRRISFQTIKKPIIKNGEALVKVLFSPVNPSDLGFSQNAYGRFGHKQYPMGLGFEGSGVIQECEDKSLNGKKICFVSNYEKDNFVGAWSDYTILNKNEYFILPEDYTDMKKAAYLFINPFTALCFIDIIKKNNYNSVIHTAGGSALGRIFTRLCHKNKFTIINTVRKGKHIDELNSIGSSLTLNSTEEDFKSNLLKAKNQFKPQISFECIGGEMTGNILSTLEEGGILYHYGDLSLRKCSNISTYDLLFMDKKICGFWLFKYLNSLQDNSIFSQFFDILKNEPNMFDTTIQGVFKPDQFEEAFKVYRNEMSKGKVLFDFN